LADKKIAMRHHSAITFGFTLILTVVLLDCARLVNDSLQSRVDGFYTAEQKHDWATMWSMVAPQLKKDTTDYEEFVGLCNKGSDDSRILSWRIIKIETKGSVPDATDQFIKGAKVTMDVTIQYKDEKPGKATDQTDYWVLMDGRWYWHWRGWPSD
jgi:hypothetical protein